MILASLLFALAAPATEPAETAPKLTAVKGLSVTIPTEIGSAIKPYIDCLVAADNAAIGDHIKSDGDAMRAISAKSRATCLPVRQSAEANAAKLLERFPDRSLEERNAMIVSALASAESLSESLAEMMDQHKANPDAILAESFGGIPVKFHGQYDAKSNFCGTELYSDMRLQIDALTMYFYESTATVRSILDHADGSITVLSDFEGEDQKWTSMDHLTLSKNGKMLTLTIAAESGIEQMDVTRERCAETSK